MSREVKAFLLSFGLHAMIFMTFFTVSRTMMTYSRPILIDFSIEEPSIPVREEAKNSVPSARENTIKKEARLKVGEEANSPTHSLTPSPNNLPTVTGDISEEQVPVPVAENPKPLTGTNLAPSDLTANSRVKISEGGNTSSPIHSFTTSSNSGDSSEKARQRYIKEQFTYIRDIITKNLSYPYMARKMGWEGRVTISFVVSENGSASDIKIIESSGFDLLDKNAVDTVRKVSPFPRPPVRAEVVIPVVYRLN